MCFSSRTVVSRIIPAYAGNTGSMCEAVPESQDHPRLRGEHMADRMRTTFVEGSSPLTRGTLHLPGGGLGLIRDHPRLRGEHVTRGHPKRTRRGSSPLTRGTPHIGQIIPMSHGIIPAYAGNTETRISSRAIAGDHPRLRGEHPTSTCPPAEPTGSSPLTRGTLSGWQEMRRDQRIIPAYAGNTIYDLPMRDIKRDHPRLRGEHTNAIRNSQQ